VIIINTVTIASAAAALTGAAAASATHEVLENAHSIPHTRYSDVLWVWSVVVLIKRPGSVLWVRIGGVDRSVLWVRSVKLENVPKVWL
jgi:hypothetical protein